MENSGSFERDTDVSRNSSPQKRQEEVGFCDPTLSRRRGERCSKRAKPTERRIVLWRLLCLHLPLLWMYASRRALASSQPIIRSHDNADNYFKKRKRRKEKTSIWPTRDQQRHLRRPSAFLFYLPGLLLSRERIKRSLQRTALFSRYMKTNGIVMDDFVSSCNLDTA